jgi:hypothetical protein
VRIKGFGEKKRKEGFWERMFTCVIIPADTEREPKGLNMQQERRSGRHWRPNK